MDRQRYLVTGASGFIGSWTTRQLLRDAEVFAVIRPNSNLWRLKDIKDRVKLIECDLTDFSAVKRLLKNQKPHHIIHLASHGVYSYQQKDEREIVVGNFLVTANLLEASKEILLNSFVNIGSVFEYGTKFGKAEEIDVDLTDTLSKYSAVKMATTVLAMSYKDDIPVTTLRPFTTFGMLEDRSRFITAIILRCLAGEDLVVAPGVFRDYIFIKDVVAGIISTCRSIEKARGEIINIGSGKRSYLEKVAKLIISFTGSKSQVVLDEKFVRTKESCCWADIKKAKKILGWSPKYSLKEALRETIEWYRKNASSVPQLSTPKAG